ncbi:alpha/beta hydrolase [Rhodococcus sovatensis]|uniref:Alpha/beta hydrolase n=1 Tax=Rhodococcus sovatensis TaxID=1805840 RepID=A0ABZ2PMX7_9NOCA
MTTWYLNRELRTEAGAVRWSTFGTGEPIVLLHGTPSSSLIWKDIAHGLALTRQVYVWDMLGFGQSDKNVGQNVGLAKQAEIFVELLDEWGLRSPSVVAHDVGGAVALRATLLGGRDFRDLTLVNAVSVDSWSSGGFFSAVKNNTAAFSALPEYAHRALVSSKISDGSYVGLSAGVLDTFVDPWTGSAGQGAFYRQYEHADETDTDEFQERLGDLTAPTTILWGRHDRWLDADYALRVRDRLPHTDFHWIEDSGHMVQHDAPALLLAHLLAPPGFPAQLQSRDK